jgi:hypothetical protein
MTPQEYADLRQESSCAGEILLIFGSVDPEEIRFLAHCFDDDAEEVDEQEDEGEWGRQK